MRVPCQGDSYRVRSHPPAGLWKNGPHGSSTRPVHRHVSAWCGGARWPAFAASRHPGVTPLRRPRTALLHRQTHLALRPTLRLAAAAALIALLPGCDNYAEVLGGAWPPPGIGAEGSLGQEAFLPDDGAWILPDAPSVEDSFPSGAGQHSETPIVVRFSESIASEGLSAAFELRIQNGFGGIPATATLVGDGRLAVVLPSIALTAGETYEVALSADTTLTDLTGQPLKTQGLLTTFTVADTDPDVPDIVTTWPEAGAAGMSAIGELVVVFDRPMDALSFAGNGWAVTVDGTPPVFDPAPTPLSLFAGFFPVVDTRVFTWVSEDASGNRQDLGADAEVELALSPSTDPLEDEDGNPLLTTVIDFTTAEQSVPTGGSLGNAGMVPAPTDAIGIASLTSGDPKALTLTVETPGAMAGDVVALYLFGSTFDTEGAPAQTIAFERTLEVTAATSSVTFELDDLDLVVDSSPLQVRFADGAVSFAFQVRRNGIVTPVRNLDVDPILGGIQDALLDTVRPELEELFGDDGTGLVISELRGLSLAGRASEPLRAADVSTSMGDNGLEAEVYGARDDGSFLTAPVAGIDVLAPGSQPLAFTLTLYDRALNASSVAIAGTYAQKGVVGPTAVAPGGTVTVEVYDAVTKLPIVGADVFVHADDGATFPQVSQAATIGTGVAAVTLPGAGGHILTVVADGYDLVSLMDVQATRVSLPLQPSPPALGAVAGVLGSATELAALTLDDLELRYADPRAVPYVTGGSPATIGLLSGQACSSNPFGNSAVACPFGPAPIFAGRVGAVVALGGTFDLPSGSFSANAALDVFALALPLGPVEANGAQAANFEVGLLDEPGGDVLELPAELPQVVLDAAGIAGVDLGSLIDDPGTAGEPLVTGETLIDGLPGSLPVAQGVSYDQGGGVWNLRIAAPGAVLSGGSLDGVVDPDLYLHAAVQDISGARSARRVRASDVGGLATPNQLDLIDAPQITAPAGAAGGTGYDIVMDAVVADAEGLPGLFRVEVVDANGRALRIFGRDPADGAPVRAHVVDLAGAATGLASGTTFARAAVVAGPGLDFQDFLWSDLERVYELTATGPLVTYTVP